MHANTHRWMQDVKAVHPESFVDVRVLEIGAKFWDPPPNHSVRPYFERCVYVGVDRETGDGVDMVCEAQETWFLNPFDVLVICSVFEHDPTWRETLGHNLQWLRDGGLLLTCFGAEGNQHHLMRWAPVPHVDFLVFAHQIRQLDILDSSRRTATGRTARGASTLSHARRRGLSHDQALSREHG